MEAESFWLTPPIYLECSFFYARPLADNNNQARNTMTDQEVNIFKQNAIAKTDDKDFDDLSSGGGLPRMSLYTSANETVKAGDFPTNTYGLKVGEMIHNLGKNVDVVIVTYRLTALQVTDDGFCSSHDSKSDLFKFIMNEADTKGFGCGAIFGQEFLVWVPQHKMFATLMCGNKTARNMAGGIKSLVGEVASFGSKKIENKKFAWFGMTVAASNTPVTVRPTEAEYTEVVDAFVNDTGVALELAPTDTKGDDR